LIYIAGLRGEFLSSLGTLQAKTQGIAIRLEEFIKLQGVLTKFTFFFLRTMAHGFFSVSWPAA